MNSTEYATILRALLSGQDPDTGDLLPDNSVFERLHVVLHLEQVFAGGTTVDALEQAELSGAAVDALKPSVIAHVCPRSVSTVFANMEVMSTRCF